MERREDEERRVEDAEGGQERGEEITHPTFFLKKNNFFRSKIAKQNVTKRIICLNYTT